MHTIERELIKVTGYEPKRKFADRQDYLGSILNAVIKLTDEDFENLSDEAATWANAAIEAKNSKEEFPDFMEIPLGEGDEDDAIENDPDDGDDVDSGVDDTDPVEEPIEASEDASDEAEPEEVKPVKKKVVGRPALKKGEKPPEKVAKPKNRFPVPRPKEEDVVLDKWGSMEGSKNSQALAMFEKGATTMEVKTKIGGTYYNILKKAVQAGHKLEKEGHLVKLTHKSEIGGKKEVKKKK